MDVGARGARWSGAEGTERRQVRARRDNGLARVAGVAREKNDRRRERREGERFDRRVVREKENVVVFGRN